MPERICITTPVTGATTAVRFRTSCWARRRSSTESNSERVSASSETIFSRRTASSLTICNRLFVGLEPDNYNVVVDTSTLPGGATGWVNTGDPDGGNDSQSVASLDGFQSNYDIDFGYFLPAPMLSLVKAGSYTDVGGDGLNPGDTLDYTFDVTNDGNVAITGVVINEVSYDLPGPIVITPPADIDLSPGETQQWTCEYVLTQADINSLVGDPLVDNVAQASGSDPEGGDVDSNPDDARIPLYAAQIDIEKVTGDGTTNGDGLTILVGSPIIWTYEVTNRATSGWPR